MNNSGPTAQIVERDGWKTNMDFVGHRKAVTVVVRKASKSKRPVPPVHLTFRYTTTNITRNSCMSKSLTSWQKFNPKIFKKKQKNGGSPKPSCPYCCCAVGSKDRSLSVWVSQDWLPLYYSLGSLLLLLSCFASSSPFLSCVCTSSLPCSSSPSLVGSLVLFYWRSSHLYAAWLCLSRHSFCCNYFLNWYKWILSAPQLTSLKRPLVVIHDLFDKSIMDISWWVQAALVHTKYDLRKGTSAPLAFSV